MNPKNTYLKKYNYTFLEIIFGIIMILLAILGGMVILGLLLGGGMILTGVVFIVIKHDTEKKKRNNEKLKVYNKMDIRYFEDPFLAIVIGITTIIAFILIGEFVLGLIIGGTMLIPGFLLLISEYYSTIKKGPLINFYCTNCSHRWSEIRRREVQLKICPQCGKIVFKKIIKS
jgi:hypothetical protein